MRRCQPFHPPVHLPTIEGHIVAFGPGLALKKSIRVCNFPSPPTLLTRPHTSNLAAALTSLHRSWGVHILFQRLLLPSNSCLYENKQPHPHHYHHHHHPQQQHFRVSLSTAIMLLATHLSSAELGLLPVFRTCTPTFFIVSNYFELVQDIVPSSSKGIYNTLLTTPTLIPNCFPLQISG